MKPGSTNPRALALQSLLLVIHDGRSLDDALATVLTDTALSDARDLALYQELSKGVCRWYFALLVLLKPYLQKPLKAKDVDLEIILLIGLYQILMMRIEDHAAVNETVKLVLWRKKPWAKGLVNGVLRQIIRDGVEIKPEHDEASYPQWMRDTISTDWPRNHQDIFRAGNCRAPMTLRVDTRQRSIAEQIECLADRGLVASAHELVESAIELDTPCSVSSVEGFDTGQVSVQDAAAQIAAVLLDCEPGMRVLDACAAPGGKTIHLLQVNDDLDLIALDQNPARLQMIEQNLVRINRQARLICGDAANPQVWHEGELFDRILADVPCSASGVIRRHPDIKLLRRASDIGRLVQQQRNILDGLWSVLKPGGLMLYSTCSIFKQENERQIEWFVEKYDNCTEQSLNSVRWGESRALGRQILPGQHNMDGFYYACLHKVAIGNKQD
ncbi:MAG: 16S rRNA (cytosine(967)-C(5))-methyltransferase RsmB [Gammaproteobacteria bacterium]|nr:MAG: 16S rRNA (cytosine(967)-C(5))-methyltransferase RsmB [Gammaproteobacteria bacterium]